MQNSMTMRFPHRKAGHCGSGALRDLLEFHGLSYGGEPISEGAAFGLAGGLGFFYAAVPQIVPPIYMVGRTADLERDFCMHLEIELDLRQTDDPVEGWKLLREELDAGRPTMVWADIGHLEYLHVKMNNTMHDIVICGYDEEAGFALVADNDRAELQRCSLESLARARNSHAFPGPNRHATWRMRWPHQLPEPRAAVRRGLARAVENMSKAAGVFLEGVGQTGLDGVALFENEYPWWPDRFGGNLASALDGLRIFIVKAGTAGAMFRSLHAEFLTDAAAWLDDPDLQALAALYLDLSRHWSGLAVAVSTDDDVLDRHAAGVELVRRIADLERRGVTAMDRWLQAT